MKKNRLLPLSLLPFLLFSCNQDDGRQSVDVESASITISNSTNELSLYESKQIEIQVSDIKNGIFAYSSNDPSIIEINEDGMMKAKKVGEAKIRVYLRDFESIYAETTFSVKKGETIDFTYHDFDQQQYRYHSTPSKGDVNILVLPIAIEGFEDRATAENLERINKCFNSGDLSKFESVSSYYYKSSYGELKLNFSLPDKWYDSGLTPEELQAMATRDDLGVSNLSLLAVDWYKKTYPEQDMKQFDSDKDGCIDGIWMIYSAPVMPNDSDYYERKYPKIDINGFWAYTLSNYLTSEKKHNVEDPVAKMISWAGLDFMDDFGDGNLDAHTYIHETGHLLGLKDYYSALSPYDSPAGCIDMMDNNIGDHSAFTKFALGWSKPIVVKEEKTIKLPSFEDSGDFILLTNDNFNGTPFDEYFTIEYITPDGLNKEDYNSPYNGNMVQGYSKPGIRISHIDNRAVNSSSRFESDYTKFYNDPISNTAHTGYTRFLDEGNYEGAMYQNTIMQKNISTAEYKVLDMGRKYYNAIRFKDRGDGELTRLQSPDDALFFEGDSFDLSSSSPYRELMPSKSNTLDKFQASNDQKDIFNFKIEIGKIDETGAEIKISYLQ